MKTHPAFAGRREMVPLSGFSGALIALLRDDEGRAFVRKAAETPQHSKRLQRQAERQAMLGALVRGVAHMPEVEREGEADGCYWFDMTFAPGRDAVTYLSEASHDQFDAFTRDIGKIVERLAVSPADGSTFVPGHAIAAKFAEIDGKTDGRHCDLLRRLIAASNAMNFELTPTAAHGDLTLENIIVGKDRKLWLIDTIDSPFDHYWIDLSKLFQDVEGRWFLHRGRTLSLGLSWELRQRLLHHASVMDSRYPAWHHLLLALTFARILPYARDDHDRAFIEGRVALFAEASDRALEKIT